MGHSFCYEMFSKNRSEISRQAKKDGTDFFSRLIFDLLGNVRVYLAQILGNADLAQTLGNAVIAQILGNAVIAQI